MRKISTGQDSTLRTYREIAFCIGGFEENKATAFLDEKIKTSPNGENEEVIADEGQMLFLISTLVFGKDS